MSAMQPWMVQMHRVGDWWMATMSQQGCDISQEVAELCFWLESTLLWTFGASLSKSCMRVGGSSHQNDSFGRLFWHPAKKFKQQFKMQELWRWYQCRGPMSTCYLHDNLERVTRLSDHTPTLGLLAIVQRTTTLLLTPCLKDRFASDMNLQLSHPAEETISHYHRRHPFARFKSVPVSKNAYLKFPTVIKVNVHFWIQVYYFHWMFLFLHVN